MSGYGRALGCLVLLAHLFGDAVVDADIFPVGILNPTFHPTRPFHDMSGERHDDVASVRALSAHCKNIPCCADCHTVL